MWHTNLEPSTYSQDAAVESLPTFCLDTYLSELASLRSTRGGPCYSDSATESCQPSQYGTALKLSTESRGADSLTSLPVDGPAQTSALQVMEPDSTELRADYGGRCIELSMKYDRSTHSWKTHRCLWEEDLIGSSLTFPKSGMTSDGLCLEVMTSAVATTESDSGEWLPTPCASDNKDRGDMTNACIQRRQAIGKQIGLSMYFKGAPCPACVERIMGWITGWGDLKPLGMDKTLEWLRSHGKY
jgi:hypothetical protein